jgi:aminoglycoside 6'-N-acetyltransferase I
MGIRPIRPDDRAEWLRLLTSLYPHHPESEHIPGVEAFFSHISGSGLHLPAEVFVYERADGGLGGFLELSVRNYAEGCEGPDRRHTSKAGL